MTMRQMRKLSRTEHWARERCKVIVHAGIIADRGHERCYIASLFAHCHGTVLLHCCVRRERVTSHRRRRRISRERILLRDELRATGV